MLVKFDGSESLLKIHNEYSVIYIIFIPGDHGLVLKSKAKHAAISAKLKKPFKFQDRQLVIQYEIAFQVGMNIE